MSIEPLRLSGPTMGTEWSVSISGPAPESLKAALQNAVTEVDRQMSTWNPSSDLMQLNAAPVGEWVKLPTYLQTVLTAGLEISQATDGAFEMNVGDAVSAWGFGTGQIDLAAIRAASSAPRTRATDALLLDPVMACAKKIAPLALDLSGIAKGYGVDRLAGVLADFGIRHALCAIDGDLRAVGAQSDGTPWPVSIERPDTTDRSAHSVLALEDCAVATSGDYRHFVTVKGHRLSHTIDPRRGAPVIDAPASVSVLAQSCMQADAMATALTVMGGTAGLKYIRENHIDALFLLRQGEAFRAHGAGYFQTDPIS
jgi:thiamine biosynthesis lipoprotein